MTRNLAVIFLLICGLAAHAVEAPADKPNIVFMLVDDLGATDAGCFGS